MMNVPKYWAIILAAGSGRRMGGAVPKQYLKIAGRRILDYTLELFILNSQIHGVMLALDINDQWWEELEYAQHPKIRRVIGGRERCHSVLNALLALIEQAAPEDWILVHDAARPCLHSMDLDQLIYILNKTQDSIGGLLGIPVRDTMKRTDFDSKIIATIDRTQLWHAYTPQMFRFNVLKHALETAISTDNLVTDEAAAIELLGYTPQIIAGHADNLKITRAEDLPLAEFYLRQQGRII